MIFNAKGVHVMRNCEVCKIRRILIYRVAYIGTRILFKIFKVDWVKFVMYKFCTEQSTFSFIAKLPKAY